MRYTIRAYLCTNFAGLMEELETDDFYEVQDFIWENCQKGYNCEVIDNITGETGIACADDFTEEAEAVEELFDNPHSNNNTK